MLTYGVGEQISELQLALYHTQNSTLLDRPCTETNKPLRSQWDYGLEGLTEDLQGIVGSTEKRGGANHIYFEEQQHQ